MKAPLTLALCLVCVAGHAKVIDGPRSAGTPNSLETEPVKTQTLIDAAGSPAQIVETPQHEGAVQVGVLVPESARAPSLPQSAMPTPLPPEGSTQLVQGLLKEGDFSVQTAIVWCMTALGLGIFGFMVWRWAIWLHERYTEYREMEPFQRSQSQASAKDVGAADLALETDQAEQPDNQPVSDSVDPDPQPLAIVALDTRTDQALGNH